jgi:hypothetical protein
MLGSSSTRTTDLHALDMPFITLGLCARAARRFDRALAKWWAHRLSIRTGPEAQEPVVAQFLPSAAGILHRDAIAEPDAEAG